MKIKLSFLAFFTVFFVLGCQTSYVEKIEDENSSVGQAEFEDFTQKSIRLFR